MTTVKIKNGDMIKISVQGHAGYNPGNDIVCAGISTLTYALLNYLGNESGANHISDFGYIQKSGDVRMWFNSRTMYAKELGAAINLFRTGMDMLEGRFPEYIKVEVEL